MRPRRQRRAFRALGVLRGLATRACVLTERPEEPRFFCRTTLDARCAAGNREFSLRARPLRRGRCANSGGLLGDPRTAAIRLHGPRFIALPSQWYGICPGLPHSAATALRARADRTITAGTHARSSRPDAHATAAAKPAPPSLGAAPWVAGR